jgi:RNA polymerase sigma-70 factor (ECF subfamily)
MALRSNADAESLYQSCTAEFGQALDRLACAYEADSDLRRDLLQEIHMTLWRSFTCFDQRCSLRTWAFRVAHNAAATHVLRNMRHSSHDWVNLEIVDALPNGDNQEEALGHRMALDRLMALIQQLRPLDRQIIVLYLEGLDSKTIADITGISPSNVTTKISRIKEFLTQRFQKGVTCNATRSIRGGNAPSLARTTNRCDAVDVEFTSKDRAQLPEAASRT